MQLLAVNTRDRDSTLSLSAKDPVHLRKRPEKIRNGSVKDFATFSKTNGGTVSLLGNGRDLPRLKEEEMTPPSTNAREHKRKKLRKNGPFATGRKFHTSAITCNHLFREEPVALRKRSTSLPDSESLNLEFLRCKFSSPAPSTSTARDYTPSISRKLRQSTASFHSNSSQGSQFLYPSNGDLYFDQKRKRGMSTIYPLRKRSLSVGDSLPAAFQSSPLTASAISQLAVVSPHDLPTTPNFCQSPAPVDDSTALIGDPEEFFIDHEVAVKSTPKGRRPFRDRSLARKIRDASPFSGKRFWTNERGSEPPRSRGESLTRMWRRIRDGPGNEYEDLQDDDEVIEMQPIEKQEGLCEKNAHFQESLSNTPIDSQSDGSEPLLGEKSTVADKASNFLV